MTQVEFSAQSRVGVLVVVSLFVIGVFVNGLRSEREYKEATAPAAAEPRVGINADALRAAGGSAGGNMVVDRGSCRSFPADPGKSLLHGVASAAVTIYFRCPMCMCVADPI